MGLLNGKSESAVREKLGKLATSTKSGKHETRSWRERAKSQELWQHGKAARRSMSWHVQGNIMASCNLGQCLSFGWVSTQPPNHPARPQKHPLPFVILRRESDTVLCMFQAFRTTFWEHTQMPVCCYHANSNASICICSWCRKNAQNENQTLCTWKSNSCTEKLYCSTLLMANKYVALWAVQGEKFDSLFDIFKH